MWHFQAGEKDITEGEDCFRETLQARRTMSIQECDFSLDKPGIDVRKKAAETPIKSLYTPTLLRKEERAALHETCPSVFSVGKIFASPTRSQLWIVLLFAFREVRTMSFFLFLSTVVIPSAMPQHDCRRLYFRSVRRTRHGSAAYFFW